MKSAEGSRAIVLSDCLYWSTSMILREPFDRQRALRTLSGGIGLLRFVPAPRLCKLLILTRAVQLPFAFSYTEMIMCAKVPFIPPEYSDPSCADCVVVVGRSEGSCKPVEMMHMQPDLWASLEFRYNQDPSRLAGRGAVNRMQTWEPSRGRGTV